MTPILEKELQKLGLSEKEAKVYLAALELGPHPVQDISRKAGVNRATTYVMIEALTKRGIVTSFERGKKRYFNAEAPDRLLSVLRVQEQTIKEQEREFLQILPQLRAILAASGEQPRVRFFEGAEGLRAIREEVLAMDAKELWVVGEFTAESMVLTSEENTEYERRLRERGVTQHAIFTGSASVEDLSRRYPQWKFRKVDTDRFPIQGEVSVFGSKIFAFTERGKLIGAIIESEELAKTLRSILKLAWEGAGHAPPAAPARPAPPVRPNPTPPAARAG